MFEGLRQLGSEAESMEELEGDLLSLVLLFLGVEDVSRLALVCKNWAGAIRNAEMFWRVLEFRARTGKDPEYSSCKPLVRSRSSLRLECSMMEMCRKSFAARKGRSEILLIRVMHLCSSRSLNWKVMKKLVAGLAPVKFAHFSKELNSSLAHEIVGALEGVDEATIYSVMQALMRGSAKNEATSMVNLCNLEGLTPLCIASARGMARIVKLFLSYGGNPKIFGSGSFKGRSGTKIEGNFDAIGWAHRMLEIPNLAEDARNIYLQICNLLKRKQKRKLKMAGTRAGKRAISFASGREPDGAIQGIPGDPF